MADSKAGDRAAFFLLGAAIGAAVALLTAPASGERTRRRLVRKGEEVADYLIDAGREMRRSSRAQRGIGGGFGARAVRKISRTE